MMKKFVKVIFLILSLLAGEALAVTYVSHATGNWSAVGTWGALKTGTITTSTASTTVTGVGTLFTTELANGQQLFTANGVLIGTIASRASNTSLTLTANAASANAGIPYYGTATVTPTTGDNVTIASPNTVTLTASAALANLTVNTGGILNLSASRIRPTGTTSISGTIMLGASTASLFQMVTINAGGVWSNTSNVAVNFQNGLTNNGTFTGGTGTQTFSTNSQALGGGNTINFGGIVAVSGAVTVTNNNTNTVTITGNLTGSNNNSTWVNGANSTLNYGGASAPMGSRVFTANVVPNTVNYIQAGAQTVKATAYSNLGLSGSGAKTLTSLTTISGNLTMSGTATAATAAALAIGGNLGVGAGTTLTVGAFNIGVTGTTSVSGILAHSSATGTKTYTGAVAINTGGALTNAGNAAITFKGDFNQSGTFTPGAGTITLNGGAAVQTISGTGTLGFANLTVNNTGGITLARNVTVISAIIGTVTLTSTCPTDYTLTSNGGATVQHSCSTTCFTDNFTGADGAAPGANWSASSNSGSFGSPKIFGNRLRLTDATLNVATFAALQRQFPGAGNKIVVEFDHFAYNGTGADGIAVVLSDALILPAPGGYGGSLGYANRNTPSPVVDGFAGGWLGVGIDEYGNFSNPTEGRNGGTGFVIDSASVRGSGSGQTGYTFHAGTGTLTPQVDNNGTAAPPHHYRITIDHLDGIHAWVTVERNTGAGYVVLIPAYDAKAKAGQAAVPTNWLLSFTGSTGASTNIHEIDNLSVCATLPIAPYTPPNIPGDFNIFDTTTAAGALDGIIQTKIAGKPFTLDIAALNSAKTAYSTTFTGAVKVELLNSSINTGTLDVNNCRSTWSVLQTLPNATFPAAPNSGRLTLAAITDPNAWQDVRLRVSYPATGTPTKISCSTDNFAIRPNSLANLVLSDTNWTTAGTTRVLGNLTADATQGCSAVGAPTGCTAATRVIHKAGQPFSASAAAQNFSSVMTTNYTGTPTPVLTACTSAAPSACTATFGTFSMGTGAAVGGLINSTTSAYSEVGSFALQLQDATFAAVDLNNPSDLTPKDCTAAGGWICSSTLSVGRFVPDHFNVAYNVPTFMPAIASDIDSFTYIGQPFDFDTLNVPGSAPQMTISAMGAAGNVTGNYTAGTVGTAPGVLWKLNNGFITSQVWVDASAVPCATCPLVVNGSAVVVGTDDTLTPGTGTATFSLTSAYYTRPASPVAAFNAALTLAGNLGVDGDAVAAAAPATYQFAAVGFNAGTASTMDAQMRYGRINLSNVYGSELLPLTITATGQYWNGTTYVTSDTDGVASTLVGQQTSFVVATPPATSSVTFGNYKAPLTAVTVVGSPSTLTFVSGVDSFDLAAPGTGNSGSVNMNIPVLTGVACNVVPTPLGCYLPTTVAARATFGVYRGNSVFIYRGRHGR